MFGLEGNKRRGAKREKRRGGRGGGRGGGGAVGGGVDPERANCNCIFENQAGLGPALHLWPV